MKVMRSVRLAALAGAGGAFYAAAARPYILHWGATRDEVRGPLIGDEIVPEPRMEITHAVTIDAPRSDVWPWIAQMGQGRGGLYSYDWLENLFGCDIHNVDDVLSELQDLEVGDTIRLVPEDYPAPLFFEVVEVRPLEALVLRGHGSRAEAFESGYPYPSWAFVLRMTPPGGTRFLVRFRSDFRPDLKGLLVNKYGIEPVQFLMQRKMMLGIKARAEGLAAEQPVAV